MVYWDQTPGRFDTVYSYLLKCRLAYFFATLSHLFSSFFHNPYLIMLSSCFQTDLLRFFSLIKIETLEALLTYVYRGTVMTSVSLIHILGLFSP